MGGRDGDERNCVGDGCRQRHRAGGGSRLLAEGWAVALAGRRGEALGETASMSAAADRALCVATDITKPAEVEALFAAIRERFGRLDLLLSMPAAMYPRPISAK